LAIGVPMAMLCVRFVKSQLFDIAHVDTVVMSGAIGVLVAAAFVAGMIPARRAASIDPVKALRVE
jgi:ABC-type antimicrobial peptide transport system permease subunit